MRTGLGRLKVKPHVAELAINHAKGGLQAVYDQYSYEGEIAAALALWADHVRSVVTESERRYCSSVDVPESSRLCIVGAAV
jgi:hypothetical protein